jgi:hypothetical protein
MSSADTAVYLYCVARSASRPTIARVPAGIPEAGPPAAHRLDRTLWTITADVPLTIYGPSRLEPRLRDLDWVSQVAVAHERMVEHFARQLPVIPAKLFTLFSSRDRAVATLGQQSRAMRETMRRIAGAEEWGVRIFRRAAAVAGTTPRAASGTDFLRAKRQARDAAATARGAAADAAEAAFEQLRRHARDTRIRAARREAGTNPPLLDAAFLIAARSRARFNQEARRQASALARSGAELVLSGPWPAYNFVDAEEHA